MRSNLGQPISMGEVADRHSVSLRSLQIAFRKYRDTTPMGFLTECRLQELYQLLSHAGGD